MQIAYEIGYIRDYLYIKIDGECTVLGKMIGKLIKIRRQIKGNR
jgi:hypothetical protein